MLINIERTAFLEVNSLQKYKKLFFSTFKLSASTFGGGFVIIPLMRKKFVEKFGWIEYGAGHSCRTSPCGHCNDRISGYLTVDYGTLRTENASE